MITRYHCYYTNDFGYDYPAFSREDEAGDWVSYDDVAALQTRLAECERENESLKLNAQYGWKDGEPPKWFDEWFLARTTFGPCALFRLPEEYSYDYKTADETYIKAEHVKRWMQLPGSEYKPMNCERDTLQARLAECEQRVKSAYAAKTRAEEQELESAQEADELRAEVARLKSALIVPGVMHCAKCNFELTRVTLYMGNGAVGAGNSDTEPCPNGCGPMWPVTWESRAREQMAVAERFFDEKQKAEAELAALREAAEKALNFIQNTEGELGITLDSGEALRDALGR